MRLVLRSVFIFIRQYLLEAPHVTLKLVDFVEYRLHRRLYSLLNLQETAVRNFRATPCRPTYENTDELEVDAGGAAVERGRFFRRVAM